MNSDEKMNETLYSDDFFELQQRYANFFYTMASLSGGAIIATISLLHPKEFRDFFKFSIFLKGGWFFLLLTIIFALARVQNGLRINQTKIRANSYRNILGILNKSNINPERQLQLEYFEKINELEKEFLLDVKFVDRISRTTWICFVSGIGLMIWFACLVL
jgi:hypothetical protein